MLEMFAALAAGVCTAAVIFGFVVTRWVIGWSRRGPHV
jgi:hypothetical protein